MKQIFAASDHAGYFLKNHLTSFLQKRGLPVLDLGPFSDESVDYPDFAHRMADAIQERPDSLGLLICGSGNGVCISANRHPHLRAALAWKRELAELARAHNDANVLCLPARFISEEEAEACLSAFLDTSFEGGRHEGRVKKINPHSAG